MIPVAIRRWRKARFSAPIKAERTAFRRAVCANQYDAVIDAQGLVKSAALVTRLAHGIKHGMDWSTAREPLASLFYNRKHHIAKQQHAVERTRELFAKSRDTINRSRRAIMPSQNIFCIASRRLAIRMRCFYMPRPAMINTGRKQTGASLSARVGNTGLRIKLPWGAPHEEARAKRLAEGFDYVDVLPRMSSEEVARVLAGAKFVVSVDTGLSHLTAALDRPNITLYGPTDPGLIGGYGKNQMACCSPEQNRRI